MGQFMTKQVFIAFAAEDVRQRDLLKGQSLNTNSTFEFVDMSVKQPYDSGWKSKTEARIKRSHGVIVLLSKNSQQADGEEWEVKCAQRLEKPMIGIFAYNTDRSVPSYFPRSLVKDWTNSNLTSFINGL